MDLSLIGTFLLDGALALIFLALWGFTVLGVNGSARRRGLSGGERFFWVALSVALPFVGAFLYLLARITGGMAAPAQPPEYPPIKDSTDVQLPQVQFPGSYTPAPKTPEPRTSGTNPARIPATTPAGYPSVGPRRRLVVTAGPQAGASFALDLLPILLGRSSQAGISLPDDISVSRRHAEIFARGSDLYIRDLGSLHGTRVNGHPAGEQRLSPGDTIEVGDTSLVLEQWK